jgi:hypothetical protein
MAAAPVVACSYVCSDKRMPGADMHVPCKLVRTAPSLLRTICEARIWGCCHKFLPHQQLPVHMPNAMALVAFDLYASRPCEPAA